MPLTVHPKSKAMMKVRLKELTSRSNGWGYAKRKQKLEEYIRGCGGYNHLANMKRLQDGQSMGAMEKFVDVDEAYAASKGHSQVLLLPGICLEPCLRLKPRFTVQNVMCISLLTVLSLSIMTRKSMIWSLLIQSMLI